MSNDCPHERAVILVGPGEAPAAPWPARLDTGTPKGEKAGRKSFTLLLRTAYSEETALAKTITLASF